MTTAPIPEAAPEPTAHERVDWLGKNAKRLIIALIVLIIAGLVVVFSFSLFSSSSANAGNVVASGSMAIDNSKEGTAILTATGLLPGESASGDVSITNVGESDGAFALSASGLVDTPASPALSGQLTLVITQDGTEIYTGPFANFADQSLGTWAPDETHAYVFTVTFAASADNSYQDAQSELDFTWNVTQSS